MQHIKVIIACEFSARVREAFRKRGFNAISCDLKPSEQPGPHYQGDANDFIDQNRDAKLLIAHPPCTYLASSGLWANHAVPGRAQKTQEAADFAKNLTEHGIPHYCIEQPRSALSYLWRNHDQVVQPYQFGDDASKQTWLYLHQLPKLEGTQYVLPRLVGGKKRWSNQRDDGQHHLDQPETRQENRSRTFPGIADAMAEQWGNYLKELYGRI